MGTIAGTANTEIEAPIERVYSVAADLEDATRWQPEVTVAECLERDGDGKPALIHMETDAKLRQLSSELRVNYDEPNRISWVQEEGDLKSLEGGWKFEDLGGDRTRATFWLEVDLGRMLSMIIRGPLVGVLRAQAIDDKPGRLKRFIESGSPSS